MSPIKIAVIVGSLRKDSFNRKLAEAITKLAPGDVRFEIVPIGTLPLYSQDDDGAQVTAVRTPSSSSTTNTLRVPLTRPNVAAAPSLLER